MGDKELVSFRCYKRKPGQVAHALIKVAFKGDKMMNAGGNTIQCYTMDGIPFGLSRRRFDEAFEPL